MSAYPITHIEISAQDRRVSADFYATVFGWEVNHMDEMQYSMLGTGNQGLAAGLNPVSEQNPAGTILLYIATDDVEGTLAKIEAAGGKTLMPIYEIPTVGWMAMFQDPGGNTLALMKWMPPAA